MELLISDNVLACNSLNSKEEREFFLQHAQWQASDCSAIIQSQLFSFQIFNVGASALSWLSLEVFNKFRTGQRYFVCLVLKPLCT